MLIYRKVAHSFAFLLEMANVRETPMRGEQGICELHRHRFRGKFRFSRGTVILIQRRSGDIQQGFPTGPWLSTAARLIQTGTGSTPSQSRHPICLGLRSNLVLAVIYLSHTHGAQPC